MPDKLISTDDGPIEPANDGNVSSNGKDSSNGTIDPASLIGASGTDAGTDAGNDDGFERDDDGNIVRKSDGTPRKRRGRKPGAGTGGGSSAGSARTPAEQLVRIIHKL